MTGPDNWRLTTGGAVVDFASPITLHIERLFSSTDGKSDGTPPLPLCASSTSLERVRLRDDLSFCRCDSKAVWARQSLRATLVVAIRTPPRAIGKGGMRGDSGGGAAVRKKTVSGERRRGMSRILGILGIWEGKQLSARHLYHFTSN